MKCLKCGAEIREGSLYCEKCGEDIHIVPDFEPEVEDTCKNTIESMTKDIFDEADKEKTTEASQTKKSFSIKRFLLVFIPSLLIAGGVASFIFVYLNSYGYLTLRANEAMESYNFGIAAQTYEKLVSKKPNDNELLEKYALSLKKVENVSEYEQVILKLVYNNNYVSDKKTDFASDLVEIYKTREDYESIQKLLINLDNKDLLSKYSGFIIDTPEISIENGKYDAPQLLELTVADGSDIFYSIVQSIDGSKNELAKNDRYVNSTMLMAGDYVINAFSENEMGIRSAVITREFSITLNPPKTPIIEPTAGNYYEPGFLEVVNYVEGEDNIFYTVDNNEPGEKSRKYTGKIVMLPGAYTYKFINIADNGLTSDIVEAYFNFDIPWAVKVEDAISAVQYNMFENGITNSPEGHTDDGSVVGVVLSSVVYQEENYYYVLDKVAYNKYGGYTYFNEQYGVNVLTGEIIQF